MYKDRLNSLKKQFSIPVTTSEVAECPIAKAEELKTIEGVDTTPTAVVAQAGTEEVIKDKEDPIKEMPKDTMVESTEVKEFSVGDRLANIRKNFGKGDGYKVATGVLGGLAGAYLMGKYAGKGQQDQVKEVTGGETKTEPEVEPKVEPEVKSEVTPEVKPEATPSTPQVPTQFGKLRSDNEGLDLEGEEFSEVRKIAKEFKQFTLQYDNPSVAFGDWLSNSRYNDIIRDRLFRYFSK